MASIVYVFTSAFTAIKAASTNSALTMRDAFVLLLAAQIINQSDLQMPPNYLTINNPLALWRPYASLGLFNYKWQILVPDNPCYYNQYKDSSTYKAKVTFDYIIVGAGPAGSVLANRLSERTDRRVLLIEAGADPIADSLPVQFFPFQLKNSAAWNFTSDVVNTTSQAMKNGTGFDCGKMLGGSSGTNAMLYVCGTDRDFNSYSASLPGGNGWDYNSMTPLIKRSEGNTQYNNSFHGTTGPLTVSKYSTNDEYIPLIKAAFTDLGYKINTDYNSKQYNGYVELQGTIRANERCSASRAFLNPIRARPNLFVMKNSYVTKVLFDVNYAKGVNVRTTNSACLDIPLFATREVILSAGALQSPKILLQSGVGKLADLPAGVPSVKVLPVGDNLQDHVYAINWYKVNPNASTQGLDDLLWDVQNYFYYRNGSVSNLNVMNHGGFINTLDANATYPDVQLIWYRFRKSQEYLTKIMDNFGYKEEFKAFLNNTNVDYELMMVYTTILNPKSRGTVKTAGADPTLPPKITSGFLTDPDDVAVLLRGVKKTDALFNSTGIKSKFAEMVKFNLPECDSLVYKSDDYWRCYFKYFTANLWHPTGTCKMGNSSDPSSVVDEKLKVRGVYSLRVADASIFPTVPTGNTQCPVYAVGQKAAEMIMAEHW